MEAKKIDERKRLEKVIKEATEQLAELERKEKGARKVELRYLELGSKFKYGGYEWIVVEKNEEKTWCWAPPSEVSKTMAFSECSNNDWVSSDIYRWLNKEFIEELENNGATDELVDIYYTTKDDWGNEIIDGNVAKVILPSIFDYYRWIDDGIIKPPFKNWFWLRTPYAANSYLVRYVYSSGYVDINYANLTGGPVAPLICLKSDIKVESI